MMTGFRVLLAEDESFTRDVVRVALEQEGVLVTACGDGAAALEALSQANAVDAALLDIHMPVAHGLHILKEVRCGRTAHGRGLPVAMLTGATDRDIVQAAMALGADAYLAKPLNREALISRVLRLRDKGPRAVREPSFYDRVSVGPPGRVDVGEMAPHGVATVRSGLTVDDLKPGMRLKDDVRTGDGRAILPGGTTLTEDMISVLVDLDMIFKLQALSVID